MKKEFLLYDFGGLAGDVGGMVGMLLGASVLQSYGFFVERIIRCLKK